MARPPRGAPALGGRFSPPAAPLFSSAGAGRAAPGQEGAPRPGEGTGEGAGRGVAPAPTPPGAAPRDPAPGRWGRGDPAALPRPPVLRPAERPPHVPARRGRGQPRSRPGLACAALSAGSAAGPGRAAELAPAGAEECGTRDPFVWRRSCVLSPARGSGAGKQGPPQGRCARSATLPLLSCFLMYVLEGH